MNNKFKRQQSVKILVEPNPEFLEYHNPDDEEKAIEGKHPLIKKGMKGKVNIILPNGQYHIELHDNKGNTIAYAPFNEEDLEIA